MYIRYTIEKLNDAEGWAALAAQVDRVAKRRHLEEQILRIETSKRLEQLKINNRPTSEQQLVINKQQLQILLKSAWLERDKKRNLIVAEKKRSGKIKNSYKLNLRNLEINESMKYWREYERDIILIDFKKIEKIKVFQLAEHKYR